MKSPHNTLFIQAFGAPRVERADAAVEIARRKTLALIVYLAVTQQPHTRDALAALFWPENDQRSARAALRRVLYEIGKALGGGWLQVEGESVRLAVEAGLRVDCALFEQRLRQCATHGHAPQETCPECRAPLAETVAHYEADFLHGFTLPDCPEFDDWQFFEAERLRRELAGALEKLVQLHGRQGEFETAIEYARRWVGLDPLHEPAQRQLILLYTWAGEKAAALRQYQKALQVLKKEYGQPPEEMIAQLRAGLEQAPRQQAYLRVVAGPGGRAGQRFAVGEAIRIGFGRSQNDIALNDDFASAAHARIEFADGQFRLRDLGSTNGTRVNGERLPHGDARALSHGDEIKIGRTVMQFEAEATAAGADQEVGRVTALDMHIERPEQ